LSPVVAAIILIAVTVAVSIAVAAWMGALTFTWMGYEDIEINACHWEWGALGNREINITIQNTGTKDVTINNLKINHLGISNSKVDPAPPFVYHTADGELDLIITYDYTNGSSYDIAVVTSSGHEFTDHFTGGQDET